jgi:hypothetical protein
VDSQDRKVSLIGNNGGATFSKQRSLSPIEEAMRRKLQSMV